MKRNERRLAGQKTLAHKGDTGIQSTPIFKSTHRCNKRSGKPYTRAHTSKRVVKRCSQDLGAPARLCCRLISWIFLLDVSPSSFSRHPGFDSCILGTRSFYPEENDSELMEVRNNAAVGLASRKSTRRPSPFRNGRRIRQKRLREETKSIGRRHRNCCKEKKKE